jgi:Ner family transcriptional regulator
MTTNEMPTSPRHRASWILYQLAIHASSYAAIAKDLGVSRQAVRNAVLFGHSPRIEHAIAKTIGRKPQDLWPERYPHGSSRRKASV